MPALRRHIITGDPILFAPERAGRPNAFGGEENGVCPFCPDNETMTPPEIERAGEPWRIRVFPNKYPAVTGHEVVVESPGHRATFEALAWPDEVVATYVRRYRAHGDAAFIALFTNHGRGAGASINHLHSQLMPLPFVPPRVERERAAFGSGAKCPLCLEIGRHRDEGLVIEESGGFVRLAPSGSSHAYEQWIVPLRHQAEIIAMDDGEIAGLGTALQRAARAAGSVSRSHNVVFVSFRGEARAHFYVMVIPRLAALAGFELGTGTFIDMMDPAAAARVLR
ncbi:MAG TPA: DUF4921 family protein [Thermoanaerobaculia bacterium]|nr:DUF4921 family protein [Thermoanaerobaculia bacterium]